jgi:enoyl-CoA hydratase/carnithine racemase
MRANPNQGYYRKLFANCSTMMQSIVALPVPVIALVQGMATAAGCQLVATCDLAIASEKARFAVSGINLGLFCSTPSVALSRNLARKRAFEMLITGKFIDAQTAADWGLVNEVVAPEDLEQAGEAYLQTILAKSPAAVRTGKKMFYEQISRGLADAYDYAGEVMACNMMEGDAAEGIDAFLEKRAPRWHKE